MPFQRNTALRTVACALALLAMQAGPGLALSEIQREAQPPADSNRTGQTTPASPVPLPEPVSPPASTLPDTTEEPTPAEPGEATEPTVEPGTTPTGPVPEILYDRSLLPEPVRRIHAQLMEACLSGDIERLRPLITTGSEGTQLSLGGVESDPIQFLKELSGDGEGHEMLAILYEVLNAGFVHLDVGEPDELYVWPYFFAVPLDRLTAPQRVELFKIVTAGDYEEMKTYGAYIFYRAGITPAGQWAFFVAGD